MSFRLIELERFRSFRSLTLELDPRGGILEAPNGRGKTNFLEALHYVGLFRSFRGAPDAELATFGARGFRLFAETEAVEGRRRRIGVVVEGARKRVAVDGREGSLADNVGTAASVVLAPEDIRLVQGSPARRRQYLDVLLALSSRRYLKTLQGYRRALRQRNRVLQAGGGHALLEPWTEQLVAHGGEILADRAAFLARWSGRFGEISGRLAGDAGSTLSWSYVSPLASCPPAPGHEPERELVAAAGAFGGTAAEGAALGQSILAGERGGGFAIEEGGQERPGGFPEAVSREGPRTALAEALRGELERTADLERRRGTTLAGPHRDDLSIRIGDEPEREMPAAGSAAPEADERAGRVEAVGGAGEARTRGAGRDLRRFGSQGEQRTAALALRFLESEALTVERGEAPVVLLDDVFSELDPARSRELLGFLVPGQQVFLTTPKPLAVELPVELPRYTVDGGVVERVR